MISDSPSQTILLWWVLTMENWPKRWISQPYASHWKSPVEQLWNGSSSNLTSPAQSAKWRCNWNWFNVARVSSIKQEHNILRLWIVCEHRSPTINRYSCPIDEACIIRKQMDDCSCYLLSPCNPTNWMQQAHLLFNPCNSLRLLMAKELFIALSSDRARSNGVDTNAVRSILDSKRSR